MAMASDLAGNDPAPRGEATGTEEIARWLTALDTVRLIPLAEHNAALAADQARYLLGCSGRTLDELIQAGLRGVQHRGQIRFDSRDIFNLAFVSPTRGSLHRLTLDVFARLASQPTHSWIDTREWSVSVLLSCPSAEACSGGAWMFAPPSTGAPPEEPLKYRHQHSDRSLIKIDGERISAKLTFGLTTRGQLTPLVSGTLREIFADIGKGMRFQFLPQSLKTNVDAILQAGVADCDGFSQILVERCHAAGYTAIVERGIALIPFGFGPHTWVRVLDDDGHWKVLEPTYPILAEMGGVKSAAFLEACGGWHLNRVARCGDAGISSIASHHCDIYDGRPDMVIRVTQSKNAQISSGRESIASRQQSLEDE